MMDSKYPDGNGSADARPRRRRDRDNPYEIFSVGIETAHPRFYLAFTDGCGVRHCLEGVLYRLQAEALRSAINELPEVQRLNCTTSRALHTRRSRRWRDAPIRRL